MPLFGHFTEGAFVEIETISKLLQITGFIDKYDLFRKCRFFFSIFTLLFENSYFQMFQLKYCAALQHVRLYATHAALQKQK